MLTFEKWENRKEYLAEFPENPEGSKTKGALEVIQWAYEHYGDEVIYACSFGVEGVVLIDLITQVKEDAKVVFLDTGVHFKETYELIEKVKEKYPKLQIEMKKPALTLEEQADQYEPEMWKTQPNKCCEIRKIIPLEAALNEGVAWFSGLRREQSESRKNTEYVNQDLRFKKIKVCPLIHWTWKEIWRYVYNHKLDYNPLHDVGYPSIGCEVCTVSVNGSGDSRDGRWAGTGKTECGLHVGGSGI